MPEPDPLEALAAKRRENQAREQAQQSRAQKRAQARAARKQNDVLRLSLESRSILAMVFTLLCSVGIAVLVVFGASTFTDNETIHGAVGAVVWLGAFLLIDRGIVSFEAGREMQWLEQVPFPLNRERYLAELGVAHTSTAQVKVKVKFVSPVPESARALVVDAMTEAVLIKVDPGFTAKKRGSKVAFRGNNLHIESPAITTRFTHTSTDGDSKTVHHNRYVHRWVRRCLDRGLGAIRTRYLIAAVDVTIK